MRYGMTDTFDLGLFGSALASAETPPDGEPVLVEWPDEFLQAWLVRPN